MTQQHEMTPAGVWVPIEAFRAAPDTELICWWWGRGATIPEIDRAFLNRDGRIQGYYGCGPRYYTHVQRMPDEHQPPPPEGPYAGGAARAEIARLREDVAQMRTALLRVQGWADAYPETVFPPVDLNAVRERLADDALFARMHAEWARQIMKGVGRIVGEALEGGVK